MQGEGRDRLNLESCAPQPATQSRLVILIFVALRWSPGRSLIFRRPTVYRLSDALILEPLAVVQVGLAKSM